MMKKERGGKEEKDWMIGSREELKEMKDRTLDLGSFWCEYLDEKIERLYA